MKRTVKITGYGGLRHNNMEPAVACNPDVIILSSAIFKDPDGIQG